MRTVGKYQARWGFTPQKPLKKAYEQGPEAVQAWLTERYPAIAAKAKAEGGEIHRGDETALTNTDVRGRINKPSCCRHEWFNLLFYRSMFSTQYWGMRV